MMSSRSATLYPRAYALIINVSDPNEVRRWCQRFGCSESQLRAAIEAVGRVADPVKNYLSERA